MSDLRPSVLDDYGLMAAIRWLGERIAKRTGLIIHVEDEDSKVDLPPETESTLFRIAQELLTNITKHAKATEVSIRLDSMDGKVPVRHNRQWGRVRSHSIQSNRGTEMGTAQRAGESGGCRRYFDDCIPPRTGNTDCDRSEEVTLWR